LPVTRPSREFLAGQYGDATISCAPPAISGRIQVKCLPRSPDPERRLRAPQLDDAKPDLCPSTAKRSYPQALIDPDRNKPGTYKEAYEKNGVVGWAERSDAHQRRFGRPVGFAMLSPPYGAITPLPPRGRGRDPSRNDGGEGLSVASTLTRLRAPPSDTLSRGAGEGQVQTTPAWRRRAISGPE
jgi:hypothetical protein